jgi:branched-chain amino acid aminotransferase
MTTTWRMVEPCVNFGAGEGTVMSREVSDFGPQVEGLVAARQRRYEEGRRAAHQSGDAMSAKSFVTLPSTTRVPDADRDSILQNPGFGTAFTDHMVTMRWTPAPGWHDGQVGPRKPFQMDPAAAVLQYAQQVFEGLKAYRGAGNDIVLFRPQENARRMAQSAERMAMPPLPTEHFIGAIEELVRIDHAWIPQIAGGSLYLRPFVFASEVMLGVRPARAFTFCLIASPVGAYFAGGQKPITVWVSSDYARAARGGTGAAKCAANYAASLLAQAQAAANGCDQTMFLDAAEQKWIEELGGMNVFFVTRDGELITPPLSGTILPGITRQSLLTLAREEKLSVAEAPYAYEEFRRDVESGRTTEAFACGTAAVVVPIGTVRGASGELKVGGGNVGPVTAKLYERLVNIQRGIEPDRHDWLHHITF